MSIFARPAVETPPDSPDDPRIGTLLTLVDDGKIPDGTRAAIIGFPTDIGIQRGGGRPGASAGPTAIRNALYKLRPDIRDFKPFVRLLRQTIDMGDIVCGDDLEADQMQLGNLVAKLRKREIMPIILGGGHESTYGHFLGYVADAERVAVINIDAHTDVDELRNGLGHWGSPFRQILDHESGKCRHYQVFGAEPHANVRGHVDYINEHGGDVLWRPDVTNERIQDLFSLATSNVLATFDLDVVAEPSAPGVASPNAMGISAKHFVNAAYEAGRCSKTTSFDIVELNPSLDIDERTARLAAIAVWNFLHGVTQRW